MQITAVRTLTQALAAPALSSSIVASTVTLTWVAPVPAGQSVIGGYRVFKSATLAGTYTQFGSTLAANVLSITDTLSGTQFYKVEAFDQFNTGNRSPGLQCNPGVVGPRFKFNPSPVYWQMDYNTPFSTQFGQFSALKALVPETRGFEVELNWAVLENPALVGGAAQYDGSWATGDQTVISNQRGFKLIDSFIAEAARLGCQLMVHIRGIGGHSNGGDVSATNFPSSFAPAYLASSAYGTVSPATNGLWGALWVNSYGPDNTQPGSNGVQFTMYQRFWDTRVAAVLKPLGAAYGARYDSNPNLETFGFAADENVISAATGCTDALQIASLTGPSGLMPAWRASFPHTALRLWANYYQTTATMDTMLAACLQYNWSIGGPDTCNDTPVVSADPTLNSRGHYRAITAAWRFLGWTASGGEGGARDPALPNYAGVVHCMCEIEPEDTSYDTVTNTVIANGRSLGDGILLHICQQANRLRSTHWVWFVNTFSGRNQVRTNTAHPNLCDWLRSVAQGGNVAINGLTAGVALENTDYPSSWPTGTVVSVPQNLRMVLQGQNAVNQGIYNAPTNTYLPQNPNRTDLACDPVSGATYKWYRSANGGGYSLLGTSATPNYSDPTATLSVNGTAGSGPQYNTANTYRYKVTAVIGGVESAQSASQSFVIYSNGVFNWSGDYNFDVTSNYADTSTGVTAIKNTITNPGGGFLPHSGNLVTEWNQWVGAQTYLEFDLKLGTPGMAFMLYALRSGDVSIYNASAVAYNVSIENYGGVPTTAGYTHYRIPLADFLTDRGPAGTLPTVVQNALYKFALKERNNVAAGSTWFIKDIVLTP